MTSGVTRGSARGPISTGRSVAKDQWKDVNLRWTKETKQPPQTRLATILLMTLAAPGVRLEHVIGTAGATTVSDHNKDLLVRQLPSMMTEALNDMEYLPVRQREITIRAGFCGLRSHPTMIALSRA